MIGNWKEINTRYNSIKDHKPRATKKLKELGEILASAYRLDPQRADEMWQYIIELNIKDNITFAKFYIAQVFNKITTYLTLDEAAQFVTMRPERVRLMLIYGYDGIAAPRIVHTIIGFQVLNSRLDDAVEMLTMLEEKYKLQEEPNTYALYSIINTVCGYLEKDNEQMAVDSFRYDIPLENIISFYVVCCREFEDEYIQAILQARICLLTGKITRDIESIKQILCYLTEIAAKKVFEFNHLVTEYLYVEREIIGFEAEKILYNYFSEANRIYLPIGYNGEDEKRLEKSNWYQDIILNSQRIIRELFRKTRFDKFHKKIIYNYMYECDWKTFLQLLVLGLNQETELYSSSYLEFIKNEIRDYLYIKDKQIEFKDGEWWVINETESTSAAKEIESPENSITITLSTSYSWRRSITKPRVTKENVYDFIQVLGRACILTDSSPINELLVDEVRAFATKETGNVDVLLSLGMEVEADNRTELEKLIDYAKNEIAHRILYDNETKDQQLYNLIRNIERETGTYGIETGKLLAKQPQILSFLFLHDAHSSSTKKDIILGALLDDNYTSALKCVDYMIETATYPNFSDCNSWSLEMTNTLCDILRSVVHRNTFEPDKPYLESITSTVIHIAEKCLPYLGGDNANKVKANLVTLKPSDENKNDFIRQLLKDVDEYTAEKKPKGYSKRLNNVTIKIQRGIEVLSKINRIDVVAQIFRKISENKQYIDYHNYESLLTGFWCIKNEQLNELYTLIPEVYSAYIETSDANKALNLLRNFGKLGDPTIYKILKRQIIQRHGYIDGMTSCFKYSVETSTPIRLCKNTIFEATFLYWNITQFDYRTGIYSAEVFFQVKNHNKEYISIFASDISINGIPMIDLKKQEESDISKRESIIFYLERGKVETVRLALYFDNHKKVSFNEMSELSFSIIAQNDENDIAIEGPFTIIHNSSDDTFAIK